MTSKVEYQGDYRTKSVHIKSGETIITDAPIDNNGKGEAFSPTDMIANSAASCMLTIMAIAADKRDLSFGKATAEVTKTMASNPRRISRIDIKLSIARKELSDSEINLLEKAGLQCPVHKSLHPDLVIDVDYHWY